MYALRYYVCPSGFKTVALFTSEHLAYEYVQKSKLKNPRPFNCFRKDSLLGDAFRDAVSITPLIDINLPVNPKYP